MKQDAEQKSLDAALIRRTAEQPRGDRLENSQRLDAQHQAVKDQREQPVQYPYR